MGIAMISGAISPVSSDMSVKRTWIRDDGGVYVTHRTIAARSSRYGFSAAWQPRTGGGRDAFIGAVHRIAARIDDQYELTNTRGQMKLGFDPSWVAQLRHDNPNLGDGSTMPVFDDGEGGGVVSQGRVLTELFGGHEGWHSVLTGLAWGSGAASRNLSTICVCIEPGQ